ncbi:hypothetical protein [Streptomyces sp. NPDC092307]|uniref:hypothetical protein n=1 Tax=Streptomyces sp. NPDC092307 TaxID=3366013 RepID=UPI0038109F55
MADETSIKISSAARDRLALLAAEKNTTIRNLVEALTESQPAPSGFEKRAAQARAELASILGTVLSPEAKAHVLLEPLGVSQYPAAHSAAGTAAALHNPKAPFNGAAATFYVQASGGLGTL